MKKWRTFQRRAGHRLRRCDYVGGGFDHRDRFLDAALRFDLDDAALLQRRSACRSNRKGKRLVKKTSFSGLEETFYLQIKRIRYV